MESLGNKLKTAREEKGCAFDQVSRETNIAIRYLEALEREDFSCFPGESYLLGFLKNYGEYLELNTAELLSLYRALKIQEQPVPVEQLLRDPSPLPKILLGVFITLLVLGAGAGVYYLISRLSQPGSSAPPPVRSPKEYQLGGGSLEQRFYLGDSILIPSGTDQYKLELTGLGEAVTVTTPGGTVILDLGQEVTVDLNRDGMAELRVSALDFVKGRADAGTLLRFELDTLIAAPAGEEAGVEAEGAVAPAAATGAGTQAAVTIFSSSDAQPFTLQAVFQGYCMFRREIVLRLDGGGREVWGERSEQYYQRSDELNYPSLVGNAVRLWVSNAQAVKLQVIVGGRTVPLELGAAGEVVVADIRWLPRDEEGRRRLALVRLE